jgi:hypothetical protein
MPRQPCNVGMTKSGALLASCGWLALGLLGCPGTLSDPEAFLNARADAGVAVDSGRTTPPLCEQDVVQTILSNPATCSSIGCHAANTPAGGLDLESPGLAERLLDAPGSALCSSGRQINLEDPSESLLYTKLSRQPSCGAAMPLGGQAISAANQACVLAWLENVVADATDNPSPMGDAGVTTNPNTLSVEAENSAPTAPLSVRSDSAASGGSFIASDFGTAINNDPNATQGKGRITFSLAQAGTYRIWGRVIAEATSSDSFWIRVDTGGWIRWNDIPKGNQWIWDDVHDSDNGGVAQDFVLTAGSHTVEMAYREQGARLDKLVISKDLGFVPTGTGP